MISFAPCETGMTGRLLTNEKTDMEKSEVAGADGEQGGWEDALWGLTARVPIPALLFSGHRASCFTFLCLSFSMRERGILVATSCRRWLWQLKYLEQCLAWNK